MLTAADISWELRELSADDLPHGPDDMLVDVLVEAQSYRTLARQAIHELHSLAQQHDRLRTSHHRLLDEYRCLREQIHRAAA